MEGVPSRFACLPDDDSTNWIKPKDKSKKGKSTSISTDAKLVTAKTKKKNQSKNEAKELQQLAFQTSTKKSKNKNKSKSKNENTKSPSKESAQYEEWKEKDEKLVTDAYAHDVENAILLSKIDFEEHKATMKIINEERTRLALLEASKKPKTMSLEQFHKLETQSSTEASTASASIQEETTEDSKNTHSKHEKALDSAKTLKQRNNENITNGHGDNEEFFQKLQQETLNTINREQLLHSSRNMSVTKNGTALNESALMEQYMATVGVKDKEISKLHDENKTLKSEMSKIKNRYKAMRSILDDAEIKEKAEILIEAEKLRKVRDEMTENITQLTTELEQSKTREHLLGKELRTLQEKHSGKHLPGGSNSTSEKS